MEVPLACTLEADAGRSQLADWRDLLPQAVASARRVAPDRLELRLRPELNEIRELALLAQREKACCEFFDFSFRLDADAVTFQVRVPADATSLLDEMVLLAEPE